MAMALMLFLPGFAMGSRPTAFQIIEHELYQMPKAGVLIDFTLDAVSSCSGSLYYFYLYS